MGEGGQRGEQGVAEGFDPQDKGGGEGNESEEVPPHFLSSGQKTVCCPNFKGAVRYAVRSALYAQAPL